MCDRHRHPKGLLGIHVVDTNARCTVTAVSAVAEKKKNTYRYTLTVIYEDVDFSASSRRIYLFIDYLQKCFFYCIIYMYKQILIVEREALMKCLFPT